MDSNAGGNMHCLNLLAKLTSYKVYILRKFTREVNKSMPHVHLSNLIRTNQFIDKGALRQPCDNKSSMTYHTGFRTGISLQLVNREKE